ncbi:MAG: hypothetical protein WBA42_12330 [Mesorhizobium sp.]
MRRALPPPSIALPGALAWALAMGASALVSLFFDHWATPAKIRLVAFLFAVGGALAFPVGLYFARLVSAGKSGETAFAAAFVSLLVFTVAFTSGVFSLQYRFYYAEWHAPAFSVTWAFQFVFTVAGALVQFAVLGLRLYFPIGFVALFVASLWFARQPR